MSRRWSPLRECGCALVDLILPARCVGCATRAIATLCPACVHALSRERPHRVYPFTPPRHLPETTALAEYSGIVRMAILEYKERGRYPAAAVLGDRLAVVIAAAVGPMTPVLLVAIPTSAEAIRRRHGDHMLRLVTRASTTLRHAGWEVGIARPLVARAQVDSAGLTCEQRAVRAMTAFTARAAVVDRMRPVVAAGAVVVLVDDIITTGVTLAAARLCLAKEGVDAQVAAVLAATRRRHVIPASGGPDREFTGI